MKSLQCLRHALCGCHAATAILSPNCVTLAPSDAVDLQYFYNCSPFLGRHPDFLFARLVDYAAAVFASIAFMLNGYFIIYLDMPHLSVEVLLPGLFLTFELLLRKTSWPRTAAAAAMISLSICGGMQKIGLFGNLLHMPLCRLSPSSITRAEKGNFHGSSSYCRCSSDLRSRHFCCFPSSNL